MCVTHRDLTLEWSGASPFASGCLQPLQVETGEGEGSTREEADAGRGSRWKTSPVEAQDAPARRDREIRVHAWPLLDELVHDPCGAFVPTDLDADVLPQPEVSGLHLCARLSLKIVRVREEDQMLA